MAVIAQRRRLTLMFMVVLALLASSGLAIVVAAPSALSAPDGTDNEGGSQSQLTILEAANRAFVSAQAALDQSKRRHGELTARSQELLRNVTERETTAKEIISASYRTGGLTTFSALVTSGSPDLFLDRVTAISAVASHNTQRIRELTQARQELERTRLALEVEVANQQRQLDEMARKKQEAERALQTQGGGQVTTGPVAASQATATPAPRRPNGSLAAESCSLRDPTTSGCLTPRTLHALQQAQAAGFTRYVACFRGGGFGEHPKGRACDFSASARGFGGIASGGDRAYGDQLAGYFISTASALGVLYVIWFRKIWMPTTGWRTYSGGGDPSSDHTNHVHLSVI